MPSGFLPQFTHHTTGRGLLCLNNIIGYRLNGQLQPQMMWKNAG